VQVVVDALSPQEKGGRETAVKVVEKHNVKAMTSSIAGATEKSRQCWKHAFMAGV